MLTLYGWLEDPSCPTDITIRNNHGFPSDGILNLMMIKYITDWISLGFAVVLDTNYYTTIRKYVI